MAELSPYRLSDLEPAGPLGMKRPAQSPRPEGFPVETPQENTDRTVRAKELITNEADAARSQGDAEGAAAREKELTNLPATAAATAAKPPKQVKWADITGSKKYQALDGAGKESVRSDYWKNYVSPQIDTEHLEQARKDFDELTNPTLLQRTKKAVKGALAFESADQGGAAEPSTDVARLNEEARAAQPARATATPKGGVKIAPADLSLKEPAQPSADWTGEGGVLTNAPAGMVAAGKNAIANFGRMMQEERRLAQEAQLRGDTGPGRSPAFDIESKAFVEHKKNLIADATKAGQEMKVWADQTQREQQLVTPQDMDTAQQAVWSFVQSAPPTALGIAVGILTRNPAAAMAIAGGGGGAFQVGSTYGEAREKGATHDVAARAAAIDGVLEGLGEAIPLATALKPGSPFLLRLAKTVPAEAGQEGITQLAQDLNAFLSYNPDITLQEAWQNFKVATLAGAIGGAVYGTAGAALDAGKAKPAGAPAEPPKPAQDKPKGPPTVDLSDPAAISRAVAGEAPVGGDEPGSEAIDVGAVRGDEEVDGSGAPPGDGAAATAPAPAASEQPTTQEKKPAEKKAAAPVAEPGEEAKPKEEPGAAAPEETPPDQGDAGKRVSTDIQPADEPVTTKSPGSDIEGAAKGLKGIFESPIDEEAHAAATSPHNDLAEPTQPQKEAGNYQKGHVRIGGLDISVENPSGSERKGVSSSGAPWSVTMQDHYGYIRGTVGKDKDHVDVFIKAGTSPAIADDAPVFIVDQKKPGNGHFDEHKVMLGYATREEAEAAYKSNYSKDWDGIRDITEMSLRDFKVWARKGDTTEPAAGKWKAIGTNAKGATLYEDRGGVRSIVEGDIRIAESVSLHPTRAGIATSVQHKGDYLTKEESDAVQKQGTDEGSVRRAPGTGDAGESRPVGEGDAEPGKPAGARAVEKPAPAGGPEAPVAGEGLSADQVTGLARQFATLLSGHTGFGQSIMEARAVAAEKLGLPVKAGTPIAKRVDEAVELGVVMAARDLVEKMRARKATDHEIYAALRELYARQPNLNVRTSTSIANQAYSTPVPLAFLASRLASISKNTTVYEPTAGNGMLLIEADTARARVNELDAERAAALVSQGFKVTRDDASTDVPNLRSGYPMDAVIANPPFGYVKDDQGRTREWKIDAQYTTNQIDHAIAMKALEAMKDDGRAVLIVGAPKEGKVDGYEAIAKRSFYFTLYRDYNVVDHFTAAGDLYAKQGAAWPVDVIVIHGRGKSALRLPQAVKPKEYGSWDALSEKLDARVAGEDRKQGAGASAQGAGERAAAPDRVRPEPARAGGAQPAPVERPAAPSHPRPDRVEPRPAGLDQGARARPGEPAAGGELRGPDRPADAGVQRLDAEKVFDEEFSKLFGDLSKSAARETGAGLEDVAKGLDALFDSKGKLGSGPTFDEETYAKAKPFFIAGVKHFKQAAADIRELMRLLLTELRTKFAMTAEAIHRMKPYIVRFMQDVQSGAVTIWEKVAPRRPVETETEHQRAYVPKSAASSIGSLVPSNMQAATQESLDALEKRVGNLDAFVAEELGYKVAQMGDYFSAEQVDSLALALDSMKRGSGFIIGDQTGIGKGRVNAGVIWWAIKNQKTPIFVTEKPNLYGDIIRDLIDIGHGDVKPVITNNDSNVPLDDEAALFYAEHEAAVEQAKATGQKAPRMPPVDERPGRWLKTTRQEKLLKELMGAGSLGEYDAIFTTYNQMQTVMGGKFLTRHDFLREFASGAVVIFDESHNAGGTEEADPAAGGRKPKADEAPKRSDFARALLTAATSAFYSSATYAKRPSVMDLYFRTDMALAVDNIKRLVDAIKDGGVPLQQIVAGMLAKAGQYIRREKSFAGIDYDTAVVKVNRPVAEQISSVMKMITEFDHAKSAAVAAIDEGAKDHAGSVTEDGSIGQAGAHSTNFTSLMHNIVNQMLLALKTAEIGDAVIEALKRGEKPVLTVANTMGSFIEDYVDDFNVNPGDAVDISFQDLLHRYLERSRDIVEGDAFGKKDRRRLSDQELGPNAAAMWKAIEKIIRNSPVLREIPLSPIDFIKARVTKEGYKFGEITGRAHGLDYSGDKPIYRRRSGSETSIGGRKATLVQFNNGTTDVLLINQAGATGLSAHAGEKFKDQRRRHMMIIQAEGNIDVHMQVLGRINRTGQVTNDGKAPAGKPASFGLPRYTQLVADVPAEKRPAAVLAKKMASLNANTTASRGSAVTAKDVVDFMNEYGDEVAAQLMEDNPEWHKLLDAPLHDDDKGDGLKREGAIRKVTGRIPLLSLRLQEELYGMIEGEYQALIDEKDRLGENLLEAKTLDLQARTLKTVPVFESKGGDSPFAAGAVAEVSEVKKLGKAYTGEELVELLQKELGFGDEVGPKINHAQMLGRQRTEQMIEKLDSEFAPFLAEEVSRAKDAARGPLETKLNQMHDRLERALAQATIGRMITLRTKYGTVPAMAIRIERKGKPVNPAAMGSWKFTFAVADAVRHVTIPATRLFTEGFAPDTSIDLGGVVIGNYERPEEMKGKPMLAEFDEAQSQSHEHRVLITGNLLAGFQKFRSGRIIRFTTEGGEVRQGILMPTTFNIDKALNEQPVEFAKAEDAIAFLELMGRKRVPAVISSQEEKLYRVSQIGNGQDFRISIAAAKDKGGVLFLSRPVLAAAGQDFVKVGGKDGSMRADLPRARAVRTLQTIIDLGYKAETSANRQEAKDFLDARGKVTKLNAPPVGWAEVDTSVELQPIADRVDADEPKRVSALKTLRSLEKKLADGAITEHEFVAAARELLTTLEGRNDAKQLEEFVTPRVRGDDYIRERLIRARRQGELGPLETDFALWLLDQAPHVATGLGFSISAKGYGKAGDYDVIYKVARVFSNIANGGTTVHEILHHTERMLPVQAQKGIRREWWRQVIRGLVSSRAGDRQRFDFFSDVMHLHLGYGTKELEQRIAQAVQRDSSLYQYVNPSEFWAVNATNLLTANYGATTWTEKAKLWLRTLMAKIREIFGLPSEAPVMRGLAAVLNGTGAFESPEMLVNAGSYAAPAPASPPGARSSMNSDISLTDKVVSAPFKLAKWDRLIDAAWSKVSALNERATDRSKIYETVRAGVESDYGLEEQYVDRRIEMQVNLQKWARGAVTMLDKLGALTREESRVAYEWMNERDADDMIGALPEQSQRTLTELKELIRSLGEEAVQLGQLSREVFERNELAYLHRSYLKYELDKTIAQRLGNRKAIAIWGEQYMGRGLKDWRSHGELNAAHIPVNEVKGKKWHRLELRARPREDVTGRLEALGGAQQLGKLRKVVYWPEDKPIPAEYATWLNDGLWEARWLHNGKVGLWRDLTKEERRALGEIDEVRFSVAKTLHLMTHDIEVGHMQKWVADTYGKRALAPGDREVSASESLASSFGRNTWVKVPSTEVKGTNVKKYGSLAGLYVPGPVWNDVRQRVAIGDSRGPIRKLWDDALKLWKISKTSMSPGVHTNNVMANFFIADFHDLRSKDMLKALRVFVDAKMSKNPSPENAELYRRFEDSGALHGMFKYHELRREALDPLLDDIRNEALNDEQQAMTRTLSVLSWLNTLERGGKKAADAMIEAYGAEDEVFRLAMFIKGARHGVSDLESGKLARKAFLDYDINAPWIQALRQSAFPFIAFPYRAIPMMVNTFTYKPWKLIKYVGVASLLNTLAYAWLGLGPDDEDRERRLMPEERAGKIWGLFPKMIRMPWNQTTKKRDGTASEDPVFLDVRRWFPAGDVFDVGGTHAAIPWSPTVLPGGPMALLAELFANKAQFTGQDITLPTDTGLEQARKVGLHLYRFAAPNLFVIPGTWSFEGIRGAVGLGDAGKQTDVFGREMDVPQSFMSALGVKLGTYPEEVMRYNLTRKFQAQQQEIIGVIYKMQGELARNKISKSDYEAGVARQVTKLKKLGEDLREKIQPPAGP